MKRYETMSKEEITEFMVECFSGMDCDDCPADPNAHPQRAFCAKAYLNEEVPEPFMVRRYQNICCKQDLDEAYDVIRARCVERPCDGCAFEDVVHCTQHLFIDYLCELEPEREKEWYLDEKYHKSRKKEA